MELFFILFAHYFGDFVLQDEWMAINKCNNFAIMLAHSFLWSGPIVIVLILFKLFALWKVVFLVVGHFIVDTWKCKIKFSKEKALIIDQLFHIFQCLIVYYF